MYFPVNLFVLLYAVMPVQPSFATVVAGNHTNNDLPVSPDINPYETVSSVQLDPFHPLYLHPNDHPGLHLVNQILTGDNFNQWKRVMTIALSAKIKLGMINRTCPKLSSTSAYLNLWNHYNDMVILWLLNSVSLEIATNIIYLSTAQEIRNDLHSRFTQSNIPKMYQVKKDLAYLTQGTMTVAAYFTKFRSLYDEHISLVDLPKCTCNCVCGALKTLEDHDQIQKVTQFLMGLDESFTNIRG